MKEESRNRLGSIIGSPTSPSVPPPSIPRVDSEIPFVATGAFHGQATSVANLSSEDETPTEDVPEPLQRSKHARYFVNGEIEVARSLGDFSFKKERIGERSWYYPTPGRKELGSHGFHGDIIGSDPFVRSMTLTRDDRYIVIATDGFWEVINPSACLRIISLLSDCYSLEVLCFLLS